MSKFRVSKSLRILSIDGGGIRGIIPSLILAEIEKRSKKRISDLFDFVAGTSTGSIIALGLTVPDVTGQPKFFAEDIVNIYENKAKIVFARSLYHRFTALNNLLEEKYDSKPFEDLLKNYFGDSMLKDAILPVLVPSYETESRLPFFFKSHKAEIDGERNFLMREVIRASTAAPTYFEPYKLQVQGKYYSLIDGGVYANNPSMCALIEALGIFPEIDNYTFVSLGTGEYTLPYQYDQIKRWGLVNWPVPILNIAFDGISDTVHYQLQKLLAPIRDKPRYYRFQAVLPTPNNALDDTNYNNIKLLKLLAEEVIRNHSLEIDTLVKQLTE